MTQPPASAIEPGRPIEELAKDGESSGRGGRTFAAFSDSNFRMLYFGNLLQFGSMNMKLVVRGWLVFHLTGSFAALGTMALANAIPTLPLSPIGGVIADCAPKKTVIQIA